MPTVGNRILAITEPDEFLDNSYLDKLRHESDIAIVVLTAGVLYDQPEYQNINVSAGSSLIRLRYATYLYKRTGFPILISGGVPVNSEPSSVTLARDMTTYFDVQPRWLESTSQTTRESAARTWNILQKEKISRIILVTDAYHMKRSAYSFSAVGFSVIEAPTGFRNTSPSSFLDYLPRLDGLGQTNTALHEFLGIFWYKLNSLF